MMEDIIYEYTFKIKNLDRNQRGLLLLTTFDKPAYANEVGGRRV